MHHDEANQALKLGRLLETGEYRYDPDDHHGPTLYYLTLPVARAAGRATTAALDERVLRLVPALAGAGAILLLPLLGGALGGTAIALAAAFAAVAPAAVYYDRFYIQESLLVLFLAGLLGSGARWRRRRSPAWAAAAGAFAGLMFATKETSLLAFAAAALASPLLLRRPSERDPGPRGRAAGSAVAFAATGLAVAAAFYSSFLKNPAGLGAVLRSFTVYLHRGGTGGAHAQPAGYYLGLLSWTRAGGQVWTELPLLALAAVGIAAAFLRRGRAPGDRRFARFLAAFTLALVGLYSALPYKTPWNVLPFHLGIVLLAGYGAAALFEARRSGAGTAACGLVLAAALAHLGVQAYRASFVDDSDPRNPFVYAQTGRDYLRLVRRVEDVAAVAAEGRGLLVKVAAPPERTWPLPWSLRRFPNVGYWTRVDAPAAFADAAVVIASDDFAGALAPALEAGYVPEHYGLRPDVPLEVFVRRDLWDRFLDGRRTPAAGREAR